MAHTRYKISNPRVRTTELETEDNAVGLCWPDGVIEVDPRQTDKDFFSTLLHELLHHFFPDVTEKGILEIEKIMTRKLWNHSVKKIIAKRKVKNASKSRIPSV